MSSQPVSQHIEQIKRAVPGLRILSAGWEGGNTHTKAEDDELIEVRFGKAGGMGVVIPQLPLAMKRFAERRNVQWSFANVVPLFTDIVHGVTRDREKIDFDSLRQRGIIVDTEIQWTFAYDGRDYDVRLWKATVHHPVHEFEITTYLLQQDDLWGRGSLAFSCKPDGGVQEPELYEVPASEDSFPAGVDSPFVSSAYSMAQFQRIRYLVFARSVAALYYGSDDGTANASTPTESIPPFHVLVSHDFHAGLAPFFEREDAPIVQLSISHNLVYQGIDAFYTPNTREANVDCRKEGNWPSLKVTYAGLLGLNPGLIDDYFVAWADDKYIGTPNWTQGILRNNFFRTGLAMTTVSPGYAEEQRSDKNDVLSAAGKAASDKSYVRRACRKRLREYFGGSTQQDDLFVPNQNMADLRKYKVVGIVNGIIPSEAHLLHKPEIKGLLDELGLSDEVDQLRKFLADSRAPDERETDESRKWTVYKERFDNAAAALEGVKKRAKEALFERFSKHFAGKQIDHAKPILFAWGRLVSQKGFHIIHEAVTSEKTKRDFDGVNTIVLGTAPGGDIEALEVERRLRCVDHDNFVFINHFDPAFRDLCLLAASGALLTSLFEPCGLTDIEAYWFGTPCVVHKTGGLVKGVCDPESYTQITENFPKDDPVAEGYDYYDNTDPQGEAEAFTEACRRLLAWDQQTRQRRQLKALTLTQFTYGIPANRYIDSIQFAWLNQVWRCLKDHRGSKSRERLAIEAADFICDTDNGFVPGVGVGCSNTLAGLYARTFEPPSGDDQEGITGVDHLDDDIELDRILYQELKSRHE